MLIAFLLTALLFFVVLCVVLAFDNAMFKEENAFLLLRSKRAEEAKMWAQGDARTAIADMLEAQTARTQAEQDALSAIAKTVELQQRAKSLSLHVVTMMRERSQQQSLQLSAPRRFHIEKSPAQKAATRSAHIN